MVSSSIDVLRRLVAVAVVAACFCYGVSSSSSPSLLPPGEANWPLVSYLRTPAITLEDRRAFEWIRDSLEDKRLTSGQQVKDYLEQTKMEMLSKASLSLVEKGAGYIIVDYLDELLNLASELPIWRRSSTRRLLKLVEFVYGSLDVLHDSIPVPEHHLGLYNYLKHYLNINIDQPVQDIVNRFRREMGQSGAVIEADLDDFIGCHGTAGLSRPSSNDQKDELLRQLAARMDLYEGNFDAKCMTKVAKAKRVNFKQTSDGSSKLDYMMSMSCDGLFIKFGHILDDYNLVRLLQPEKLKQADMPASLLKLNEYARLCNQFSAWNTRQQVLKNLRGQQEWPGLKAKLTRNLVRWFH